MWLMMLSSSTRAFSIANNKTLAKLSALNVVSRLRHTVATPGEQDLLTIRDGKELLFKQSSLSSYDMDIDLNSTRTKLMDEISFCLKDASNQVDKSSRLWQLLGHDDFKDERSQAYLAKTFISKVSTLHRSVKAKLATHLFKRLYGDQDIQYSDFQSYYTCFYLLRSCVLWRESITLLNDLKRPSRQSNLNFNPIVPQLYSTVITTSYNAGHNSVSKQLLDELVESGEYDSLFFSKVMSAAVKNKFYQDAIDMMELQLSLDVLRVNSDPADIKTARARKSAKFIFSLAINSCNRVGDYDKALQYIEQARMILTPTGFDVPLYDVVMTTCAKCGEWELALRFLNHFLSSLVNGGGEEFNQQIWGASQSRSKKEGASRCEDRLFDNKMFNLVLHACAKSNNVDVALQVLDCMCTGQFGDFGQAKDSKAKISIPKPSSQSYNAVLEAYKPDTISAYQFFNKIPSSMRDVVTYNTLMWMALKSCHFERVVSLFQESRGEGISGDFYTFNVVMKACYELGSREALLIGLEAIDLMLDKRDDMIRMNHNQSTGLRSSTNSYRAAPKTDRSFQDIDSVLETTGNEEEGIGATAPNFVPLDIDCLMSAIVLCHRAGEHTRALQFDREFQFNYPSAYERLKDNIRWTELAK